MSIERAKVIVQGAVQGVGFRPFIYSLATDLGLHGWVLNSAQGVAIEVEGQRTEVEQFLLRVENEKPPRAVIQSFEATWLEAAGYEDFEIRQSDDAGAKTVFVMPDIATCPECLREMFDPRDRRHLYPFINCTNCGPRFSIIKALPYDRSNTSMKKFALCSRCEAEYRDPRNRRFHAQPNACPDCGPQLQLWDESGRTLAKRHKALQLAAQALSDGRIVALKGIGGFQLLVDARNEAAVRRLRDRKHREEKPFALMYPSLEHVRADCTVSPLEERLLMAPEAPIVLLRRLDRRNLQIVPSVAPGNPAFGVMLPYSALHHLLLRELGFPLVATSGNLTGEPICIDELDAFERLRKIADMFLVHDRPILRPVDDSVARVLLGREQILRRARGYAPLPVHVKKPLPAVLAVGAQLKSSVALGIGNEVFISQHIGDLETEPAYNAFQQVAHDLPALYETEPEVVACDLHPEYLSTQFARDFGFPVTAVQHHYAHVLAVMAENELEAPVLGVAWDGTGLGLDGTIWGGEFLLVDEESFQRAAHLRTFRLPGGEAAIRQPRRCALGALFEVFGEKLFLQPEAISLQHFTAAELSLLRQMLVRRVNAPVTSSAGRLFDAVASLAGLRQETSFEGQAAMELEFAISPGVEEDYPFELAGDEPIVIDWRSTLRAIADEAHGKESAGVIAAKFHNTLAAIIVAVARRVGEPRVVLTGGCFQNEYLTLRAVRALQAEGFHPAWHQRVPPNDGGIALGQVMAAARVHRPVGKSAEELLV
jgi:hydrogenase maturation protein HypF